MKYNLYVCKIVLRWNYNHEMVNYFTQKCCVYKSLVVSAEDSTGVS